ncbi:MAM and LDL-receptor class A domain-containing protein 1-like [Gigantopelta aegis]|uniref:MAM and LDL-receptor class A domain-containing protein 1-like n=1 Tax=Gigantopelta aegis TaxID=1735272 RepID=UPI001B888888|nr:MAM and LDL-receptor class A domain-containing protein 1-like [Gigantopelta aegis]
MSPAEFSFWYHMNGPGIGSLSVFSQSVDGTLHELWSKHGRQGSSWHLAKIMLQPGQYKLVFSAIAKHHVGSNIAIDDVVLNTEVSNGVPSDNPPIIG